MNMPVRDKSLQHTDQGLVWVITEPSGPDRGHCLVQ